MEAEHVLMRWCSSDGALGVVEGHRQLCVLLLTEMRLAIVTYMYGKFLHRDLAHQLPLFLDEPLRQNCAARRSRTVGSSRWRWKAGRPRIQLKWVQVRQAGVHEEIAPRGRLALRNVESIRLWEPAI
eukprot:2736574-Pleurochrysis_carterae.AAC.4